MSTRKEAADAKTVQYWTDYFGDYGKILTGNVPRRVAKVVAKKLARKVAGTARSFRIVSMQIRPLTAAPPTPTKTGGLTFEGWATGVVERDGERTRFARAFTADFDQSNAMVAFDDMPLA